MASSPITDAIHRLREHLHVVASEEVALEKAYGRVLAEELRSDRDSPALSVSAMDGYAVSTNDLLTEESLIELPVQATSAAGSPPLKLQPGQAIQIFTGAPIPSGCDAVIKREDTVESESSVTLDLRQMQIRPQMHIRHQGENVPAGDPVLEAGSVLTPASAAALASFAPPQVCVRKLIRVAVLNTGDELAQPGEPVEPWQIRDSNGPTLAAWLKQKAWIEITRREHVADQPELVKVAVATALESSDAVILTGGVSMGDTDYVPSTIEGLGGKIHFHRLPLRPGKPILGASLQGKLILGLPGNPVSVAVTSRAFGDPLLAQLAGIKTYGPKPLVSLAGSTEQELSRKLGLTWFRLVQILPSGQVAYMPSKGSGDLVALSKSSGFVEVLPDQDGPGPWPFTSWSGE